MIRKVKMLMTSLLNNSIIAVENSGYNAKEELAARMDCKAEDVLLRIGLAQVEEEHRIQLEIKRLQQQFSTGLKKSRKEAK